MGERGETFGLVKCLNQLFRNSLPLSLIVNRGGNAGNCKNCCYDPENNGKCENYKPIVLYFFEVVDRKS